MHVMMHNDSLTVRGQANHAEVRQVRPNATPRHLDTSCTPSAACRIVAVLMSHCGIVILLIR